MRKRTARRDAMTAMRTAELAAAAPVVIAERLSRMALAGASPSVRDRNEFNRMGIENLVSFQQSWNAMAVQALRANQQLMMSWMQAAWTPWTRLPWAPFPALLGSAAMGVLGKGLVPVHRRAVANARRLGNSR